MFKVLKFLGPFLFFSNYALSESVKLTPITEIISGSYMSNDPHFVDVEVHPWANDFIISGAIPFDGRLRTFAVQLRQNFENQFVGQGMISASTSFGECQYPIMIELFAYVEGLFIKSREPRSIPANLADCIPVGPRVEVMHRDPYTWVAP